MGVSIEEVKKLAELARLELSPEEVKNMQGEIDSILSYIDVVREVELPGGVSVSPHMNLENVMRADGEPHEPGIYTEKMLSQAPRREGKFIAVKKILGEK